MSLKRLFQFGKPKNPGYGISKGFYLSVLAGHAQLPSPDEIANPSRARGAVEGFLAPLMEGSTKEDLQKPLSRGMYALASKDRASVVKLMVVSKEEAGFDTEALAKSSLAAAVSEETIARVRATWTLLQLTFESHDPMVAPAMAFLYEASKRMTELTEGVLADPLAQLYMLPQEIPVIDPSTPLEAVDHISVQRMQRKERRLAFTRGMAKFGLPEFELWDVPPDDDRGASAFLLSLCQTRLGGRAFDVGDRVGSKAAPFDIAVGGLDRELWEGLPCLELLPARGKTAPECLKAWVSEQT